MLRPSQILSLIAATAFAVLPATTDARDRGITAAGARQQSLFYARIVQLADRLERSTRRGMLPQARAGLMRQDLMRVWAGANRTIEQDGMLSPGQQASYAAMLSRVDRRLSQVDAGHGGGPMSLR